MKKIYSVIITTIFLVPLTSSFSQTIVIGAGASIVVPLGADLCAGEYGNIYGNLSGEGTQCGTIVTFESDLETNPTKYALYQNYPNPFNPSTLIKYDVPEKSFVSIRIYDLLGEELASLVNEYKPAGSYEVQFNASNFGSGIYFYKIQSDNFIETRKMVLMK